MRASIPICDGKNLTEVLRTEVLRTVDCNMKNLDPFTALILASLVVGTFFYVLGLIRDRKRKRHNEKIVKRWR